MKKLMQALFVLFLITTFVTAPGNVSANVSPSESKTWEWDGESVEGEEIPMSAFSTTPGEWYQLMANGLKVDGPTQICHEFDEGRNGWTGEIFQLIEGAWVKLSTTIDWAPNEEGQYQACAAAPAAGTYALFGYWQKSDGDKKVTLPRCRDYEILPIAYLRESGIIWWIHIFIYNPPTPSPDTQVTYYVINANQPIFGDVTGTTTTYLPMAVLFDNNWSWQVHEPVIYPITFTLRVVFPQCYIEQDYSIDESY